MVKFLENSAWENDKNYLWERSIQISNGGIGEKKENCLI